MRSIGLCAPKRRTLQEYLLDPSGPVQVIIRNRQKIDFSGRDVQLYDSANTIPAHSTSTSVVVNEDNGYFVIPLDRSIIFVSESLDKGMLYRNFDLYVDDDY